MISVIQNLLIYQKIVLIMIKLILKFINAAMNALARLNLIQIFLKNIKFVLIFATNN